MMEQRSQGPVPAPRRHIRPTAPQEPPPLPPTAMPRYPPKYEPSARIVPPANHPDSFTATTPPVQQRPDSYAGVPPFPTPRESGRYDYEDDAATQPQMAPQSLWDRPGVNYATTPARNNNSSTGPGKGRHEKDIHTKRSPLQQTQALSSDDVIELDRVRKRNYVYMVFAAVTFVVCANICCGAAGLVFAVLAELDFAHSKLKPGKCKSCTALILTMIGVFIFILAAIAFLVWNS